MFKEEAILSEEKLRVELLDFIRTSEPADMEFLIGVLLRKCGFKEVNVTQLSRDGGIDGTANLMLNNIVSIKVVYQCKRYAENNKVEAAEMDAFCNVCNRQKAEKGLFITTSKFTKGAIDIANEDSRIILIDSTKLLDLLIENEIGFKKETGYVFDPNFIEEQKDNQKK